MKASDFTTITPAHIPDETVTNRFDLIFIVCCLKPTKFQIKATHYCFNVA